MVDDNDFIVKVYTRKNGRKNVQKWYMHYCVKCNTKRSYMPKFKVGLCSSCAWNWSIDKKADPQKILFTCKNRKISQEQKTDISMALKGNKNAAKISKEAVIARTAKRMKLSIEQYLAEKETSKVLRKIKKNMSDRLIRFIKDERRSIKYFAFDRNELLVHLSSKFHNHPETDESMTWLNYGRISGINCWEIDHKIPLRYKENGSFYWNQEDLRNPKSETFKKAWALENLQPKWAKYNWSKGSKFKE